jgi:uncharacterized protein
MRGPLVYCLESADNNDAVRRMSVTPGAVFNAHYDPNLLGGVTAVTGTARVMDARVWGDALYAPARSLPHEQTSKLIAIPYYANANRGRVDMSVWLPEAG